MRIYNLVLFITFILSLQVRSSLAQEVELRDGRFYIDEEPFFIKGIGYEAGATPGLYPWERPFNPAVLHNDMQRIEDGGFNTIRTWAAFTAQELNVIQQYDIKIIMGIWIDPAGDFGDPAFINQARDHVEDVLAYSKNYPNIIGYLIMNEPTPEVIAAAGYQETAGLWSQVIDIIHASHPGRPVSFANTCNGTYVDTDLFDFVAYNAYIYNPVTINYLLGYRDYVSYLTSLKRPEQPLIISEYGLSVSPSGPGNWGYGGNSFQEQTEGILHMYKSLVDGGAAGSCVFNYSDGWWKSGNPFAHDGNPEEWFGLVSYNSLSDQFGSERPVWQAVRDYQSVIIAEPRSGEIYSNEIPLEFFIDDPVNQIEVYAHQTLIHTQNVAEGYVTDTIVFPAPGMADVELEFRCFNAANVLIKSELKNILVAPDPVQLPDIEINFIDENVWQNSFFSLDYEVTQSPDFTSSQHLDYVYYPHVGFDYGNPDQAPIPQDLFFTVPQSQNIVNNVHVFTVGAAFTISKGSFEKRISALRTFSRINEISTSIEDISSHLPAVSIFPNPARNLLNIKHVQGNGSNQARIRIFDLWGRQIMEANRLTNEMEVDISRLPNGVYFVECRHPEPQLHGIAKFVKF